MPRIVTEIKTYNQQNDTSFFVISGKLPLNQENNKIMHILGF